MSLGFFGTATVLVGLAIAVPFVYAFLWPNHVPRTALFLTVTVVVAFILGVLAFYWSALPLREIGFAGQPSVSPGEESSRLDEQLSERLYLAAGTLVLMQSAICWAVHAVLSRLSP